MNRAVLPTLYPRDIVKHAAIEAITTYLAKRHITDRHFEATDTVVVEDLAIHFEANGNQWVIIARQGHSQIAEVHSDIDGTPTASSVYLTMEQAGDIGRKMRTGANLV